ncbi:MAG TPA: NERD domain-containing protein [Pseudogracilibacillus sp.]|nr:NERD domain-containing protein [Pseudogracilibacillus sp.]
MAQLLKSLDYISRYESNPFHYSSEFIRLKQENWAKLLNECESQRLAFFSKNTGVSAETLGKIQEEHATFYPFKKHQANKAVLSRHNKEGEIKSKTDLMHYFLNQICLLHIKRASSILIHTSLITGSLNEESDLIKLLQRFPDIYFIMYLPIFYIKNALVEANILLISLLSIEIIEFVNYSKAASVFIERNRFWTVEQLGKREKIISLVISLHQTEQIVQNILRHDCIEFPIKKTVVAKECRFYISKDPYQVQLIDRPSYYNWFQAKRKFQSPFKNTQLNGMNALLKHSQTSAVKRPEWTEEMLPQDEQIGDS